MFDKVFSQSLMRNVSTLAEEIFYVKGSIVLTHSYRRDDENAFNDLLFLIC